MARSVRGGSYTPTRGQFAGVTFRSYRQYRNALEAARGGTTLAARQRRPRPVPSQAAYARLTPSEQATQRRAAAAVATMKREGISLREAARREHTTPNAVRKYAAGALVRRGSRLVVRQRYRLYREMAMLTPTGIETIGVTDSETASRIAQYWNAVSHYLATGDAGPLQPFRGKSVRWEKRAYPFITDTDTIDHLFRQGHLSFESIYRQIA
jgi:hypothetical protein